MGKDRSGRQMSERVRTDKELTACRSLLVSLASPPAPPWSFFFPAFVSLRTAARAKKLNGM